MKRHQKEKVNRKCVELKNTTGRKKKRQITSRKKIKRNKEARK